MNCANCNTELKLVFDSPMRRRDDYTTQYDNALAITLGGGYGMFFDFIFDADFKDLTALLCHDCAHEFARTNKWVMDIFATRVGEIPEGRTADEYGHMHERVSFAER